jgi:predicted metal-binding membrane protein
MKIGAVLLALAKRQSPALLAVSVAGWAALLAFDQALILPVLCGPNALAADGVAAMLVLNPPGLLMLAWSGMLLAMMPPLLTQAIAHLRLRSLSRRRWRATAVFVAGYAAVWLAVGAVLTALALMLGALQAGSGAPAWFAAIVLAVVWQIAPTRQHCLNRCHRVSRLSAFGLRADLDCLRYGVSHGFWCAGVCWPLMLLPLTADRAHLAVMVAVMPALVLERARAPRPARWGLPLPRSLLPSRLSSSSPPRLRTAP